MRSINLAAVLLLIPLLSGFVQTAAPNIEGLWLKKDAGADEFRFYYFHKDGIGLYRYGKRHLNNTNSFEYKVEGRTIRLTFKKTGEAHQVRFVHVHRFGF